MPAHTEATWCVYADEFIEVYTSDSAGVLGLEECRSIFVDRYGRRVTEKQWRVVPMQPRQPSRYRLELLLPNLRGEYKGEGRAQVEVKKAGDGAIAVRRGSKEEAELLATVRRRLRDE